VAFKVYLDHAAIDRLLKEQIADAVMAKAEQIGDIVRAKLDAYHDPRSLTRSR
jgi:phage terminase large subunit-like protein